jgi:CRP-like cAMP-binding protein
MGRRFALTDSVRANPRNALLAAVPQEVLASLRAHLKPVSLPRGTTLCEAEQPLSRIHFVETGAVSLATVLEDGTTAEMATVGREGVVEVDTLLGGGRALGRYVVALSGFALAVEASRFQSALREMPELRATCEVYAQAFLANLLQNVACNATHSVEERYARWLLMWDDQVDDDAFELTQEYLADVLGVRRATVTVVARTLQDAELIRYRRGAITVLDRRGLEAAACECYRIVRYGYERALTRMPGLTLRRASGKGSEVATRATPSRLVADEWLETEPEE